MLKLVMLLNSKPHAMILKLLHILVANPSAICIQDIAVRSFVFAAHHLPTCSRWAISGFELENRQKKTKTSGHKPAAKAPMLR